ncbi:MAG: hypothetical protein K6D03_00295 [Solobacterium sp.]|nr:hypothetical protein [Solobacterium sp.]
MKNYYLQYDVPVTDEQLERIRSFSTPELCDGAGLFHTMDAGIRQRIGTGIIAGRAVTVDVPSGEGAVIAEAVLQLKKGDILVIAGHGNCDVSYWGDHRSICAALTGAEGVVIDGAFRDAEGCEDAGFPVFARALTNGSAQKSGAGAVNVPVSCGGAAVLPGDVIAADQNGIIVLRPSEVEQVMEKALRKRQAQEETLREMNETGRIIVKIRSKKG